MTDLDRETYFKKSGIYKIKSLRDNRVYIGSAKSIYNRYWSHDASLKRNNHHSKKLQRFYNKYGKDSIEFEVIEYVEDITSLLIREQYYIDLFDSYKKGFNGCPKAGNTLGKFHSNKTKKKIGLKSIGRVKSEETRKKLSIASSRQEGETGYRAKLTNKNVKLIKQMLFLGYSNTIISEYFKVSYSTIENIKNNTKWRSILFIPPSKCLEEIILSVLGEDKSYRGKLTLENIRFIIQNKDNYKRIELARMFNTQSTCISRIILGKDKRIYKI